MRNIRAGLGEALKTFGIVFGVIAAVCVLLCLPFLAVELVGTGGGIAVFVIYFAVLILSAAYEIGGDKRDA